MLLLTSVTDKLQVVTASAVTVDVHASWVDNNAGTITPGRTNSAIVGATTTDVVASPAASTQRNVQSLVIHNKHATSSNLLTIRHTDGTTAVDIFSYTILPGEELSFLDGVGFRITDAAGAAKTVTSVGRYLSTTVILTGTTTYTTPAGCTSIFVRVQAGGGGGGGCTSLAAAAVGAGGGGAGGYAEKTFAVTPNTAYTCAVGAAGAGVSNAAGNNGGNSTFAVGATTVTAFGGTGGPIGTAATTLVARGGGAGGVVSTNGDVNGGGMPGNYGVTLIVATPIVASGCGGSSDFGSGGLGLVAVGNGNNANGFGAGGGGSATGASAVRTGGNGTAGVIIVDAYA
jgi:hypothetical protein